MFSSSGNRKLKGFQHDPKTRTEVYTLISKGIGSKFYFMASYLIGHIPAQQTYMDHERSGVEEINYKVLRKWDDSTDASKRTWPHIKSILSFLGKDKLIQTIEAKYGGE